MTFNQKFADWMGFKTYGESELEKVVIACNEWLTAFRQNQEPRWLTLLGASGVGKTHCLKSLWQFAKQKSDWSQHDYFPKVIYWPKFVQNLRRGDSFEMRDEMRVWPVLFLDDIGAERDPNGFATEELHTLLGVRSKRWTLLSGNLTVDGLKSLDMRIASRVIRDKNICVQINARDHGTR